MFTCFLAVVSISHAAKGAPQPAASSTQKSASTPTRFGVDFSYSESMPHIGVWWHVTPMIALRPSLGIRNESQTTDNVGLGTSSETSSTVFQFGLSLPIYLAKFKALDLFVAPAFNFKSTSSKTTSGGTSTSSSASGFDLGASLGGTVTAARAVPRFWRNGLWLC